MSIEALWGARVPIWCKYAIGDNSNQSVHSFYKYTFFTKGRSFKFCVTFVSAAMLEA